MCNEESLGARIQSMRTRASEANEGAPTQATLIRRDLVGNESGQVLFNGTDTFFGTAPPSRPRD